MKYILLLAFFAAPDGKTFLLQSTSSLELDSKTACEAAGAGIWDTFKTSKATAMNMVAWCVPKDAQDRKEIYRLNSVGK
jgi:hypothetical protein